MWRDTIIANNYFFVVSNYYCLMQYPIFALLLPIQLRDRGTGQPYTLFNLCALWYYVSEWLLSSACTFKASDLDMRTPWRFAHTLPLISFSLSLTHTHTHTHTHILVLVANRNFNFEVYSNAHCTTYDNIDERNRFTPNLHFHMHSSVA